MQRWKCISLRTRNTSISSRDIIQRVIVTAGHTRPQRRGKKSKSKNITHCECIHSEYNANAKVTVHRIHSPDDSAQFRAFRFILFEPLRRGQILLLLGSKLCFQQRRSILQLILLFNDIYLVKITLNKKIQRFN